MNQQVTPIPSPLLLPLRPQVNCAIIYWSIDNWLTVSGSLGSPLSPPHLLQLSLPS